MMTFLHRFFKKSSKSEVSEAKIEAHPVTITQGDNEPGVRDVNRLYRLLLQKESTGSTPELEGEIERYRRRVPAAYAPPNTSTEALAVLEAIRRQ